MDKIEVTQADIDEATSALSNIRGYKIHIYPEHSLVQAFARHRLSHTPQSVEPVATNAAALVEALTGEARAAEMSANIMRDARRTGGWAGADNTAKAFDRIARRIRQALAPFTEGQDDELA